MLLLAGAFPLLAQSSIDSSMRIVNNAKMKDQKDLEKYLHALESDHAHDFRPAMDWLCENSNLSRPALRNSLEASPQRFSSIRVIKTLACIAHPEDVPLLGKMLREDIHSFSAAQALLVNPSPDALEVLLVSGLDLNVSVAHAALSALKEKKSERSRSVFEQQLVHASAQIRYDAVLGLEQLGVLPSKAALQKAHEQETDPDVSICLQRILTQ